MRRKNEVGVSTCHYSLLPVRALELSRGNRGWNHENKERGLCVNVDATTSFPTKSLACVACSMAPGESVHATLPHPPLPISPIPDPHRPQDDTGVKLNLDLEITRSRPSCRLRFRPRFYKVLLITVLSICIITNFNNFFCDGTCDGRRSVGSDGS